jgi:hypothetical protein
MDIDGLAIAFFRFAHIEYVYKTVWARYHIISDKVDDAFVSKNTERSAFPTCSFLPSL